MSRTERPTIPLPFPAEPMSSFVPAAKGDITARDTVRYEGMRNARSRAETLPMPLDW